MRSLCTTGLLLLVGLCWASTASAQGDIYGSPSLLPLPGASPFMGGPQPAAYPGSPTSYNGYDTLNSLSNQQPSAVLPTVPPTVAGANNRSEFENGIYAPGDGCCGDCGGCCNTGCCPTWFGAVGGLVMGRSRANPYWTSAQGTNPANQLLNTQNAGANWAGGGIATIGWAPCGCCGPAFAFTYWGLSPMTGSAFISSPTDDIVTPIDVTNGNPTIGPDPASHFFDGAHAQRIERQDFVNSLELNAFAPSYMSGRLQATGLLGFRYLRFDERLLYGSVAGGHNFGDNGGADEAYLNFRTVNNMYGFQVGGFLNYMVTNRLGVFVMPKVGLMMNQMNNLTQLYRGDGLVATGWPIGAHKTDFAFLGELDTGLSWAFASGCRAFIGYRVLGIANIDLADNQFLPFLADTAGFAQVKQNGALIIHGAFAGLAFGW